MLAQSAPTNLKGKFPISIEIQNAKRQYPASLGCSIHWGAGWNWYRIEVSKLSLNPVLVANKAAAPCGHWRFLGIFAFCIKSKYKFLCSFSHLLSLFLGCPGTSGYMIPVVSQGFWFLLLWLLGLRLKNQYCEPVAVVHTDNPWAWRGRKIRSQGCPLPYSEFEASVGSMWPCFSKPKQAISVVKKKNTIDYLSLLLLASLISKY